MKIAVLWFTLAAAGANTLSMSEYIFNTNGASWNQAMVYCEDLGANLLTLKTGKDYEEFKQLYQDLWDLSLIPKNAVWVGLYDSSPPHKKYTWVDCSPMEFSSWAPSEPDSVATDMCIRITDRVAKWKTTDCYRDYLFVCERPMVGSCGFRVATGKLIHTEVAPYDSLEECKDGCLNQSTCAALQYQRDTCHFSKNSSIAYMQFGDDVYQKTCHSYIITNQTFELEDPQVVRPQHSCRNSSQVSTTPSLESSMVMEQSNAAQNIHDSITSLIQSDTYSSLSTIDSSFLQTSYFSDAPSNGLTSHPGALSSESFQLVEETASTSDGDIILSTIPPSSSEQPTGEAGPYHRSVTSKCTCVCKISAVGVDEKISSIAEELHLNTTSLSRYIRKKTSAKDARPSATTSGVLGIVVFVFFGFGLVFMDVLTFGSVFLQKGR